MIRGLYTIADRGARPQGSLSELARAYLEGGAEIVQLRMKCASDASKTSDASKVEREAREIMRLKDEFDFTFIVNDFVDVALEVGADGVHVGATDEAVDSIRARAGRSVVIGYSSHSPEEALRAQDSGADYVALGAIYPSPTKGPGHPVQGAARLREAVGSLERPVVAIGGIGRGNLDEVLSTGASAVAMISALAGAPDVVAETRWFVERLRRYDG